MRENLNAANIFGKPKTNTDFLPYNGDGFKLSVPSKWNQSREVEYPGQLLRYEDNFDPNSNVVVMVNPTKKKSVTDYGSPQDFLSQVINHLHYYFHRRPCLVYKSIDSSSLPNLLHPYPCNKLLPDFSTCRWTICWENKSTLAKLMQR